MSKNKSTTTVNPDEYYFSRSNKEKLKTCVDKFKSDSDNDTIVLSNLGIDDSGIKEILNNELKKCHSLADLHLNGNRITDKGTRLLIPYAKSHPSLESVNLLNNPVSLAAVNELDAVLKKNKAKKKEQQQSLKKIEKGKEPESDSTLLYAKQKDLTIKLKGKTPEEREEVLHDISSTLKREDCRIESITIQSQELLDNELMLLCNGIAKNTSLIKINLKNNKLSRDGISVLAETLKINRFCKVTFINFSDNISGLSDNINNLVKLDKFIKEAKSQKKIDVEEKQQDKEDKPQPIAKPAGEITWESKVIAPTETSLKRHKEKTIKTYPFITPFLFDNKVSENKPLQKKITLFAKRIAKDFPIEEQEKIYFELKGMIANAGLTKFKPINSNKTCVGNLITKISFQHPTNDSITIDCLMDPKGEQLVKLDKKNSDAFFIIGKPNNVTGIKGTIVRADEKNIVIQNGNIKIVIDKINFAEKVEISQTEQVKS